MAVESYLPPVVTRLSMNIDDFVAGVAKAKTALKALDDRINIPVDINTTAATAKIAKLKDTVNEATLAQASFAAAVRDANAALLRQSAAADLANASITSQSRRLVTATAAQGRYKAAVSDTADALTRLAIVGPAAAAALPAGRLVAAAARGGGGGRGWFGIPLTATAIHWIISGSMEILAVAVPALFALAAAAAVAAEGYTFIQQHMQAAYTAAEATNKMFGQTTGNLIGLKSTLQQAQTAMDPAVFGTLGSGLKIASSNAGLLTDAGKQVTLTFQTFAAKVATEFGPGGSMARDTSGLLAHMASDLTGFGQLFGNLFHGLIAFANQMPGLAEILLRSFAGIAGAVSSVFQFTDKLGGMGLPILTVAMGLEEFSRWGGLAVSVLTRLGIAAAGANNWSTKSALTVGRFTDVVKGLLSVGAQAVVWGARMSASFGATGLAGSLTKASYQMENSISNLSAWQAALIVAGAVGLGFLIDKLVTARTTTQQFTDALQANVMAAKNLNVLSRIGQNIGQIQRQISAANAQVGGPIAIGTTEGLKQYRNAVEDIRTKLPELHQGLTQQQQDLNNVAIGASYLAATYQTSFIGALALADLANVTLAKGILGTGQSAVVARAQIASLVQGYQAMGQSTGEVGADMTALAIQSGLAASQVSKLNSAWDDIMSNMTGGTSRLGGFVDSLQNIGSVVVHTKNNLDESKSISLTTGQFAQALTSFSDVGSQAWQNFGQVVGSTAPQIIDWLRTAGAEGAIAGPQFQRAVLGIVSSLSQLAAKSPVAQADLLALAQQADPNIKTWSQLTQMIKSGNISIGDTSKAIEQATIKMGNMAGVAQSLGNVLQSAVISAMSTAEINAIGLTGAMQNYDTAVKNGTTATAAGHAAYATLYNDLRALGYSAQQATQLIQLMQSQIDVLHGKTVTVSVQAVGNGLSLINNSNIGGTTVGIRSPTGLRGYARGTSAAASGWAWVGESGAELVNFSGGERVIPSSVSRGYASGTGDDAVHEINVYLDGRQIYRAVQKKGVETQRRTGSNQLATRRR